MNSEQRIRKISNLMNTSVDDCRSSLDHYHDPRFLCDLLIECHKKGHSSRELVVRSRIAKLIKRTKVKN